MIARIFSTMAACVVLISSLTAGAADVFRMETDIFVGGRPEPLVQYLTLFTERIVYDFRVTKPEEITVYDLEGNRVVLIDPVRKWKSTLTTEEVLQFTAALKSHIEPSNQVFYAATQPNFEVNDDEKERRLTLSNKFITYRIKGDKPKNVGAVRRYQEFADWSARLSAMRPGNLPPFARIDANKVTAEKGWLPEEVERIVNPNRLSQKKLEARSHHLVNWILSVPDQKRIEQVGDHLISFKEVPFSDFRDAEQIAQTEKPAKR